MPLPRPCRCGANTAEVVGYFGKNTDVTIPEYFGNYFVYSIDTSAFLLHNGIGAVGERFYLIFC